MGGRSGGEEGCGEGGGERSDDDLLLNSNIIGNVVPSIAIKTVKIQQRLPQTVWFLLCLLPFDV
jgi:hypothetical protein